MVADQRYLGLFEIFVEVTRLEVKIDQRYSGLFEIFVEEKHLEV